MSLKDYEIINKLGSGSFGTVYKARIKSSKLICVIKQIDMSHLNHQMKNWTLNEAKLMKDIDSDYIVKFYNSFVEKEKLYIVMEYCPKGDLASFMKSQIGKPLKQQIIWRMAIQITIGLHDLHSKKILHRDIKAMNIFLDAQQNIRIGDLGVAKTLKTDFTNTIVGTPYYLSPEMCQEKPYNQKTDIWAMGCLVYQLCTGKYPFEAQNQASLALKIVIGKFKEIPSHYSKDLDLLIRSCLSVDHKRRPTANYLLGRPRIIEEANKAHIIINKELKIKKSTEKQKIDSEKIKSDNINQTNKKININSKRSTVSNFYKPKVAEVRPNIPIVIEKKQKMLSAHRKVEQKQMQNEFKVIKKNTSKNERNSKEKLSSKQKQKSKNDAIYQKKSQMFHKQQVKLKRIPLLSQNQYSPLSQQSNKSSHQKIKTNQRPKNKYQCYKIRQEINKEDKERAKQIESIPSNSSSSDQQNLRNLERKQLKKSHQTQFIGHVQTKIDDDELEIEFGITPEKKKFFQVFQLKKTRTINWDCDEVSVSGNQIKKEGDYKSLPTVKTTSIIGEVSVMMDQPTENDQIYQEIDDNQPYKSDQDNSFSDTDVYLIQEIQEEQQFQKNQSICKMSEDYERKLEENRKRLNEIQKKKLFHRTQLMCIINEQQYQKLKKVIINGSENEVDKMLSELIKNGKDLVKFYKIFHYDIEIQRCRNNIITYESRLKNNK